MKKSITFVSSMLLFTCMVVVPNDEATLTACLAWAVALATAVICLRWSTREAK